MACASPAPGVWRRHRPWGDALHSSGWFWRLREATALPVAGALPLRLSGKRCPAAGRQEGGGDGFRSVC